MREEVPDEEQIIREENREERGGDILGPEVKEPKVIEKTPQEEETPSTTTATTQTEQDQTDLIKQAIINKMREDGLEPDEFSITNISIQENVATGWAIPSDPDMDSLRFDLEKQNQEWIVINYGTG